MPLHPHRLAVGGLLAMAAAVGIGRFIYTPILPPMAAALDQGQGAAGLIAGANFLGYLAGALAAGLGRLPGGARGWLLPALLASGFTSIAMGLVSGLVAFVLLRFAGGLASALALVLASNLVLERLTAAGRPGLSAVHFAGVGVGITLSALIAGVAGADWRAMWFAGGGATLLAVPLVAWMVPSTGSSNDGSGGEAGEMPARLWPLATAYGLFGFGYVITATFLIAILRASDGLEAVEPLAWLLVGLTAIPSVALWVACGRRLGVRRAFALAALVEAAGVGASVLVPGLWGAFAAALLLGATFMGLTALGLIAAREIAGGAPRRAIAVMTAAFGIGQMLGPPAGGIGHDLTGSFTAPSLLAVVALVFAAALAGAPARGRR